MLAGFMASDVENVIGIDALAKTGRWWQLKYVFIFIPIPGKISNLAFSNGLVQSSTGKNSLEILETSSKNSHAAISSHWLHQITVKTNPSFLKASYMFPFFVGGFLKHHPLRKGRGREKQMGSSSTRRVEVAPAAWRGALQWCGHAPLQRLRRAQGGSERLQRRRCGWRRRD